MKKSLPDIAPFEQLWDGQYLREEVKNHFGEFAETRWSLDAGAKEDMAIWEGDFNRHTQAFVYQAAWNTAVNLEKDKYIAIRDVALSHNCKTALDYGCGIGSGVITLALTGIHTVGAEINKHCLDFLRDRLARFKVYNAAVWDLYDGDIEGQFDLVICTEVFEHVEKPHDVARLLLRDLLKPGGIAVLSWSFVPPMIGHLPQHFHLQNPYLDQLLTMGFGKFIQDELGMTFIEYSWINNMIWVKQC